MAFAKKYLQALSNRRGQKGEIADRMEAEHTKKRRVVQKHRCEGLCWI